jgi:hypothetical protein
MKRFLLGLLILALLLGGSWLIHQSLRFIHEPIAEDLEQAAHAALQEEWGSALLLARRASDRWHRFHHFTAAFADHTPMDELDQLFAQLPFFAHQRENPHFSTTCQELSTLARAMAESQSLSWWNLL